MELGLQAPRTHSDSPAPASQVLRFQACTTTCSLDFFLLHFKSFKWHLVTLPLIRVSPRKAHGMQITSPSNFQSGFASIHLFIGAFQKQSGY